MQKCKLQINRRPWYNIGTRYNRKKTVWCFGHNSSSAEAAYLKSNHSQKTFLYYNQKLLKERVRNPHFYYYLTDGAHLCETFESHEWIKNRPAGGKKNKLSLAFSSVNLPRLKIISHHKKNRVSRRVLMFFPFFQKLPARV